MTERVAAGGLKIAKPLFDLVADEIAPGSGIDAEDFWAALGAIVADLGPKNRALLEKRDTLQQAIDDWHKERAGQPHDATAYKSFLNEIGYLVPEGDDFQVAVDKVDPEVAQIAGPNWWCPYRLPVTRSTRPTRGGEVCMTRSTVPMSSRKTKARSEVAPTIRFAGAR